MLQKFHGAVGNWGIAIILLTFVVKVLTLYWTTKSMRSMKAMAALASQMKVLQAKYADDKQRQQAQTMALYKQHNVNPVAGCLPILLLHRRADPRRSPRSEHLRDGRCPVR